MVDSFFMSYLVFFMLRFSSHLDFKFSYLLLFYLVNLLLLRMFLNVALVVQKVRLGLYVVVKSCNFNIFFKMTILNFTTYFVFLPHILTFRQYKQVCGAKILPFIKEMRPLRQRMDEEYVPAPFQTPNLYI